jgi:hypothetical protein
MPVDIPPFVPVAQEVFLAQAPSPAPPVTTEVPLDATVDTPPIPTEAVPISNDIFLPTFRAGHQLSLTVGAVYTHWSVDQGNNVSDIPDAVDPVHASGISPEVTFRYVYHVNLLNRMGFYVGSSAALNVDTRTYDGRFHPGPGILFPSITVGLSTSIADSWRVMGGVEYGAAWYPWMYVKTNGGETNDLSPVPNVFNANVIFDYFYNVSQGISLEFGARRIQTTCLDGCSDSIYLNSLDITGDSLYFKTGIIWLVGEIR